MNEFSSGKFNSYRKFQQKTSLNNDAMHAASDLANKQSVDRQLIEAAPLFTMSWLNLLKLPAALFTRYSTAIILFTSSRKLSVAFSLKITLNWA